MTAIHQALFMAKVANGGVFPDFPTIATEWARFEVFRETGYSSGDGIEPLTDWSGNGRHFTHSGTDISRPKYEPNVINGQPAANGNHPDNLGWNTGPDMSGLTAVHALAVMLAKDDPASDIGDTGFYNCGTDALSVHIPYVDGVVYDDAFSTVRKTTGNPDTNLASAFVLYEVISTATEWTRMINGATSGNDFFTTATNAVAAPSVPTLLFNAGASSRHKLAAWYIFSAKLSGGDRTAVVDYLNDPDIFNTAYA